MKLLKKILLALGALVALILLVALFVKKDYSVEREIVINKPKQEVFDYVKHLKNQNNFSTFAMKDPEMKTYFRGTDGEVGFVSGWESKMMGNGEQEIKKITDGERIDTELRFGGAFPSVSPGYISTESVGETQTKVKWAMSGKMSYPLNFMQLFFSMDDMIGKEYAQSLQNLKAILEK